MRVQRLHHDRKAAEQHAQALADRAARPVLWGQHPLQKRGWLVEMLPSGYADELVVLTLPGEATRRRATWPAQVLELYLMLRDLRDRAAVEHPEPGAGERFREIMQALLDRAGFTANDLDAMTPGAPKPPGLTRGKRGRPVLTTLTPYTTPERSRVSALFTDPEETP